MTGLHIVAVKAVETAMLLDCSEADLRAELPGRTIEDVGRVGKFLVLRLDGPGEFYLTVHLGMTGQILVTPAVNGEEPEPGSATLGGPQHPHTRFLFLLETEAGSKVRFEFRDMRKFGRVHLTAGGPAPRLRRLGPDAWKGDWEVDYLAARLRGRKAPLKAFLLDQRNLAGIGNIYADETLWWSRLAPTRPAGSLTAAEVRTLATEIRLRLEEGVRRLGCTLADFVDIEGRPGGFQEELEAYGRQGKICTRCGEVLVRVVVAGRGTTYCPGCQK